MAYQRAAKSFPLLEVVRAPVPCYGDEIAFILGSKDGTSAATPRHEFQGRFYNPDIHRACFALPTWWRGELLK